MDWFKTISIIILIVTIITLVTYYVLNNKYKMISQTRVLESLIVKLHSVINNYYQGYLKYIDVYQDGIDKDLYKELKKRLKSFKKIQSIKDMIEEYLIIDGLLKEFMIILEDTNNANSERITKLNKRFEEVNKVIQEYDRNVLIMDKYLYMFSSIIIAKIYKFKEYPYFRSRE